MTTANPRVQGEGTDTSGNAQGGGPAPRRLLALAHDPQLCQALQDLDNGAPSLFLADDLAALTDELLRHGSAIVLLDAAALDSPLQAVVDALHAQFPDAVLMVAGHSGEQNLLASRISDQAVFRFVHKPASPQRLRLFMDAAARVAPRREPPPVVPMMARAARNAAQAGAPRPPSGGFRLTSFHIGIAALALAVITAWLLWPQPAPPPPAAVVDPAEEQERAMDQALRTAEAALLAGNLPEAATATEQARRLQPDNPRVAFLAAQLQREQERAAADAQQQQVQDSNQAQLRAVLARMGERLRTGALLEPLDDSAAALYRDARRLAPDDPAVQIARDALVSAMLNTAEQGIGAGRIGEARQLVDVAARLHANAPGLDQVRRRISDAVVAAQVAQAAAAAQRNAPPPVASAPPPAQPAMAEATPATAAAAPEPVATAVTSPPATTSNAAPAAPAVVETPLKLVRRVEAQYPTLAWDQQISGWVELEFLVGADGNPRDIRVTASEPGRTFDAAAMTALRRYRYEPATRNGVPVEARGRIRMRFTAPARN